MLHQESIRKKNTNLMMKIKKFEGFSENDCRKREFHPKRGETKYFEGEMYNAFASAPLMVMRQIHTCI